MTVATVTPEHNEPDHDAKVALVPQPEKYRAMCHSCIWKGRVRTRKSQADIDLWDHLHRGRK